MTWKLEWKVLIRYDPHKFLPVLHALLVKEMLAAEGRCCPTAAYCTLQFDMFLSSLLRELWVWFSRFPFFSVFFHPFDESHEETIKASICRRSQASACDLPNGALAPACGPGANPSQSACLASAMPQRCLSDFTSWLAQVLLRPLEAPSQHARRFVFRG